MLPGSTRPGQGNPGKGKKRMNLRDKEGGGWRLDMFVKNNFPPDPTLAIKEEKEKTKRTKTI